MTPRAIFVGLSNPYSADPARALYPAPKGSAGYRLCVQILGLAPSEYLANYRRVNLCMSGGASRYPEAQRAAGGFLREVGADHPPIVLLGYVVARAFGLPTVPFVLHEARKMIVLPHPSGRCRLWHEVGAVERARELLRSVGAL